MDDQTEDQINQRLNKLRGVDDNQVPKTYQQTTVIHADDLLAQMEEQIAIEKDLPDPNTEIEERLAKLRGVDVDQVRNPGRGLDNKPPGRSVTTIKVEPEMLLHDHSSYTMPTDEDDESLSKDISDINQEVSMPFYFAIFSNTRDLIRKFICPACPYNFSENPSDIVIDHFC